MVTNFWPICAMFLYVFFYNIIKINFLYCFIILLHLISSFLHTRSSLFLYVYVSIESISCILLSSFELEAILSISSVKSLCFSLLNLCCVFSISLFFYEFCMIFFKTVRLYTSILFFLDGLFCFRVELLLISFYNLQI